MSGAASLLSQTAVAASDILIAVMLLIFMILTSIIFDGIGVSVASCSRDEVERYCLSENADCECAETVFALIDGAEKVNNVCADVIGDICGVLSGACGAAIAAGLSFRSGAGAGWLPTLTSAAVAALTVGGKAFLKGKAVKNADKYIAAAATLLSYIYTPRNKKDKNR